MISWLHTQNSNVSIFKIKIDQKHFEIINTCVFQFKSILFQMGPNRLLIYGRNDLKPMIHSPYTYIQIIIDFTFTYFLHITNANHLLVNYLYHKEKQQRLVGSESGKMCVSGATCLPADCCFCRAYLSQKKAMSPIRCDPVGWLYHYYGFYKLE